MIEQRHIDILQEHLPYELDMLEQSLLAWSNSKKVGGETAATWFARNSAIEAFWTHARTLHEFFSQSSSSEGRTACANDFTGSKVPFDFGELAKRVGDINTQFSHLNYGRPRGEDPDKLNYYFARRTKEAIDRAVAQFQKNLRHDAARYWKERVPTTIEIPETPPGSSSYASYFFVTSPTGPAERKFIRE